MMKLSATAKIAATKILITDCRVTIIFRGAANSPQIGPHGFHIYEGGSCNPETHDNPFTSAGGH